MHRNDDITGTPAAGLGHAAAPFLAKLAKHLALLACLALVIGAANRHPYLAPLAIFSLVVAAAIVDTIAHTLSLRERRAARPSRHGP